MNSWANRITFPAVLLWLLLVPAGYSQLVTRYALLVNPDETRAGAPAGLARLAGKLEENGFLKGNIRILQGKDTRRDEILLSLYEISKKAQPGDLVFFGLQARAGQVPTVSPAEKDGLDEVFLCRAGSEPLRQSDSVNTGDFLLDNQLSKFVNKVRDKLGYSGCLVLGLDVENQQAQPELKRTEPAGWLDFFDVEADDQRSRLVLLSRMAARQNQPEGPGLAAWLTDVLTSEKNLMTFEELHQNTRTEKASAGFQVSGNLDEPFFSRKPESRNWREFKRKITENHIKGNGRVFALVVGASDYRGKFENLRYAPSDAVSFYQYLKKALGPRFVDDTAFLLLNERASSTRVFQALKALNAQLKPEDALYFYFAGHGDVEGDLISRPGFLLLPDGPEKAYSAGGHIAVSELKEFLANFLFKGCRVFMLVDACHSGSIGGNSGEMDDNFFRLPNIDRELVRFLACQPNESSFEGPEFGGGFGAFTYYLLRGMQGDADANKDKITDVNELSGFLRSGVASATGNRQNPLVDGPGEVAVSPVVEIPALASLKSFPHGFAPVAEMGKSKDSLLLQTEKEFYKAIASRSILIPEKSSALSRLRLLEQNASPAYFQSKKWAGDFVQAAFEKSQSFINQYIAGNESVARDTLFRLAARELDAGLQYLTPEDANYFPMVARSLFFRASSVSPETYRDNDNLRKSLFTSVGQLRNALKIEAASPHIENALGRIFSTTRQFDSAIYHYRRAISMAPRWKFPFNNMGACFLEWGRISGNQAFYDSSVRYFGAAIRMDARYLVGTANLAEVMREMGRKDEAKRLFQKCMFLNIREPVSYHRLADIYRNDQVWDSAFAVLDQGLAIIPADADLLIMQANCFFDFSGTLSGNSRDSLLYLARANYHAADKIKPGYLYTKVGLSNVYWSLQVYDSSAIYAGLAWGLDSSNADWAHYQTDALLESNNLTAAENVLRRMDRLFPSNALRHLKWGLLWRKRNNLKLMMGSFISAARAGLPRQDFENQQGWESFSREKWYPEWLKIWKK